MRRFILIMLFSACLAGCNIYDVDEVLIQREDISMTLKATDVLIYKPDTYQLGYNAEKNEFRVFDDQMAYWFILTCTSRPSVVGQEVEADLKWTSPSSTKTKRGLKFEVMKTDAAGHIWLWCDSDAIGLIVKEL